MTLDPFYLIERLDLSLPLIGLYDAPDPGVFRPLAAPPPGVWACVFLFYDRWLRGETLHLTVENHGCAGAGGYLFGVDRGSREDQLAFLVDQHGTKAAGDLLAEEGAPAFRARHGHVLFGPLRHEQHEHLLSVTFLVNPDQLAALVWGAHYFHASDEETLVTAPFSSGCGLLAAMLQDLHRPRAVIGATDLAMRRFLPPAVLAFTVTTPLFEELCRLDERSFLAKEWMETLRRARRNGLGHVEGRRRR